MDIEKYIEQFNLVGKNNDDINCNYLSQLLYTAYLKKFKVTFDQDEFFYFKEYQERVFDLTENLRELNIETISVVLSYLNKENPYLTHIIIMSWSLPRTDHYLSKKIYNSRYQENIKKFNHKLSSIIEHDAIKNFCIETLSKTNNVPIHCIDFLWYYMNSISIEFIFVNLDNAHYLSIIMPEHDDSEYIEFGINMLHIVNLGLGKIIYPSDPMSKGPLMNLLKVFMTDIQLIDKMMKTKNGINFAKQLLQLHARSEKLLEEKLTPLPNDLINELEKMLHQR